MKYLSLILFSTLMIAASRPDLPSQFRLLMKENLPTYVIANAGLPYSYDPLEDLNLNNSRIIRMIHARIIDSDAEGKFHSRVLESYNYHAPSKTMILKLKENVKYTDGSLMTVEDVALAIKRNAYFRPNLPGVSKILGLDEWLKNKYPLLSELDGVKIEKNKLTIKFTSDLDSPMNKFNARFGVIPTSSVDLKTGKLKAGEKSIPPSAGLYKIVPSRLSDGTSLTEPTFIKLERRFDDPNKPKLVWIGYMSPSNIGNYLKDFHNNVVICAHEIDIEPHKLKQYNAHFSVHVAPKIMYSFLILNPFSNTFKDQRVRQYFAKKYRDTMAKKGYSVEGSQPTNQMLGYLDLPTLENLVPAFSEEEEQKILTHLRQNPPVWMKSSTIVVEPFAEIFNITCQELKIPLKSISDSNKPYQELWESGDISIRQGYSTLGPADPTGDIKTVFSGIHSFLKFVTDDPNLQKLVQEVQYNDEQSHFKLNKYLFVDSRFAVISNYSRLYFSTGKPKVKNSFRRQEPLVWEFFQH